MNNELVALKDEEYCYLTTAGRKTGKPHEIEIWFGVIEDSLYMLSGGGAESDWVKNLMKTPQIKVRIADQTFEGVARIKTSNDEDESVRKLLAAKYQGWQEGKRMSEWGRTALVVAVDFE